MRRLRNFAVATHRGAAFFGVHPVLYLLVLPAAAVYGAAGLYVGACFVLDPEEVDRMAA